MSITKPKEGRTGLFAPLSPPGGQKHRSSPLLPTADIVLLTVVHQPAEQIDKIAKPLRHIFRMELYAEDLLSIHSIASTIPSAATPVTVKPPGDIFYRLMMERVGHDFVCSHQLTNLAASLLNRPSGTARPGHPCCPRELGHFWSGRGYPGSYSRRMPHSRPACRGRYRTPAFFAATQPLIIWISNTSCSMRKWLIPRTGSSPYKCGATSAPPGQRKPSMESTYWAISSGSLVSERMTGQPPAIRTDFM